MANNPKLTVLFEKMRGKVFELDKPQLSAGRKEGVDICIKDSTLSSYHCDFIRTDSGTYILRDNDSTNGTRVNNIPIKEQELKNSDIIQLGAVEMLYDSKDDSATTTVSRTHTIDLSSAEMNLSTVKDLSNFSPFAAEEMKRQAKMQKIMLGILILFGVILIGAVGFLLYSMFFKTPAV